MRIKKPQAGPKPRPEAKEEADGKEKPLTHRLIINPTNLGLIYASTNFRIRSTAEAISGA